MKPRWIIALIVLLVFGGIWLTGAFDKPLTGIGLNTTDCIQGLFGNKMCGDEAVHFCRDRYDPQLNGDGCDPILEAAGTSGGQILAQKHAAAAKRRRAAISAARMPGHVGEAAAVADVLYTVRSVVHTSEIATAFGEPVRPQSGDTFLLVSVDYDNQSNQPIDPLCGGASSFRLTDNDGRTFTPDNEATLQAAANTGTCLNQTQPGSVASLVVAFQISPGVTPTRVLIGALDADPPPSGSPFLSVPIAVQ